MLYWFVTIDPSIFAFIDVASGDFAFNHIVIMEPMKRSESSIKHWAKTKSVRANK